MGKSLLSNFEPVESDGLRNEGVLNAFTMSPIEIIESLSVQHLSEI